MTGRTVVGGGVLLRRLAAWWTAEGVKAAACRLLGTFAAAGFVIGLLLAAPVLWWPLAAGWLIASWCTSPAAAETDQEVEETAEEDEQTDPVAIPTAVDAHRLTARLAAGGTSVLLTRLAAELAAQHPDWVPSTKAVRDLLATASIRVREGVRTPDGNGPGVHHHDAPPTLPPPGEPLPAGVVGDVGAGRSANANANNTEPGPVREGFYTVPHPTDPHRTEVRWVTEPVDRAS